TLGEADGTRVNSPATFEVFGGSLTPWLAPVPFSVGGFGSLSPPGRSLTGGSRLAGGDRSWELSVPGTPFLLGAFGGSGTGGVSDLVNRLSSWINKLALGGLTNTIWLTSSLPSLPRAINR